MSLLEVVLARPGYAGTLAAVRDLARGSISSRVLSQSWLECARWSRSVSGVVRTGPQADPAALLEALEVAARRLAGRPLLLPTCDASAWTYSAHADRLSEHYRTYAPPFEAIRRVLDKWSLHKACLEAGVAVPRAWTVHAADELEALRGQLVFPAILKPLTHVRRRRNDKGEVVFSFDELRHAYSAMTSREQRFAGDIDYADANGLLVQEFAPGEAGVYSVAGFSDRSGRHFIAHGARKILMRSEPVGVGVCFESAPLETSLVAPLRTLLRNIGYFGVFEMEFVRYRGRWAAIDFNPRFYNQMALDITRGMPLARLCYYDAIGDTQTLSKLLAEARAALETGPELRLADRFTMALVLGYRRARHRLPPGEAERWRAWADNGPGAMVDLIRAEGDSRWVWPVHIASEMRLGLRKLAMGLRERTNGSVRV